MVYIIYFKYETTQEEYVLFDEPRIFNTPTTHYVINRKLKENERPLIELCQIQIFSNIFVSKHKITKY